MEIGLVIQYDGKNNYVLPNEIYKYSIGSIMCEYARLSPTELRSIISSCSNRNNSISTECIAESLEKIKLACMDKFGVVISIMFVIELFQVISNLLSHTKEEIDQHFLKINQETYGNSIREFILEYSDSKRFNADTIGGILDYSYYVFSQSYSIFKVCFNELMRWIEKENIAIDGKVNEQLLEGFFQCIQQRILTVKKLIIRLFQLKANWLLCSQFETLFHYCCLK